MENCQKDWWKNGENGLKMVKTGGKWSKVVKMVKIGGRMVGKW